MRKHFVLGAIVTLIPISAAYADTTGAGSGQPASWGQGSTGVSKPMRPPLKSSKINVNHTNVTTTNATTSPSTSSSTSPSQAIQVKTKDGVKIQTNTK
ncbi:MAG: hypothetical protein DKT66_19800 [Candidatus Melainabacteria bacterium]|nr:MAG: hypothetical protein DKT66_19800 [Candidatus Melainabacteria bacterium]